MGQPVAVRRVASHGAVGDGHHPVVRDAACHSAGVVGDGAVDDGHLAVVQDAAAGEVAGIVGHGAAAEGQRPGVGDAAASERLVADDRAIEDGDRPVLVEDAAALGCVAARNGEPGDRDGRAPRHVENGEAAARGFHGHFGRAGPFQVDVGVEARQRSRQGDDAGDARREADGLGAAQAVRVEDGLAQRAGAAVVQVADGQVGRRLEGANVDDPVDDAGKAAAALVVGPGCGRGVAGVNGGAARQQRHRLRGTAVVLKLVQAADR